MPVVSLYSASHICGKATLMAHTRAVSVANITDGFPCALQVPRP